MSVYINDREFNLDHILITNFENVLNMRKSVRKENKIDFSSIKSIMGDKQIINLSFQDQLKDSIIYG